MKLSTLAPYTITYPPANVTRAEFDALKAEVLEMKALLHKLAKLVLIDRGSI